MRKGHGHAPASKLITLPESGVRGRVRGCRCRTFRCSQRGRLGRCDLAASRCRALREGPSGGGREELAVVGFEGVETVIVGDEAVEDAVGLEVG